MTHSPFIRSLLSYLLVASFVLTPVSPALAVLEGASDSSNNFEAFFEAEGDSDDSDDSEEESEEERDRRLSEETASEVSAAAAAAGIDIGVEPMYGSEGAGVNIGGLEMSKERALVMIDALSGAKDMGILAFVSIDATVEEYAAGLPVCAGCVVGLNTATVGTPTEVAKAESDYLIATGVTIDVRNIGNLVPVVAKNLSAAIGKLGENTPGTGVLGVPAESTNFDMFGNVVVKQNPYQGYTAQQVNHAGKNRLTNTSFTYDVASGNFIGGQNGAVVPPSSVPDSERIITLSNQSGGKVVSIDFKSGKGVIASQDISTGRVTNYDSESGEILNSNVIIDDSIEDLLFSPTSLTEGVEDPWGLGMPANKLVNLSPMQKAALGESISSDDINLVAEIFAQVAAGENAPLVEKIGRGQSLTATEMAELYGILGVMINRAAAEGSTILSHVTEENFSSWNNGNKERLAELIRDNPDYDHKRVEQMYLDLLNGTAATRTFSNNTLSDITPAPFATHFYSGSPSAISWNPYIISGTDREIGEHVFTNILYEDRSAQQYKISTKGLPRNITVLNTTSNPIGGVGEVIAYDDFFAGNILNDEQMLGILGPVYDYRGNTRPFEVEEIVIDDNIIPNIIPRDRSDTPEGFRETLVHLENEGKTRDLDITDTLRSQLNYAAAQNGVRVEVTSGGQMSLEEALERGATKITEGERKGVWVLPNGDDVRVGSTRHDHGDSADIILRDNETGRKLDMNILEERAIMQQFLIDAVAAGATGIGAGVDYMGKETMHVGGGMEVAWGAEGKSANAPEWVKDALDKGREERKNFDPSKLPTTNSETVTPGGSDPITSAPGSLMDTIANFTNTAAKTVTDFVEDTPVIKDAVDSVTDSIDQMNNMPFFNTILGFVSIFGFPTGSSSPSDGGSNGDNTTGGENTFTCPPSDQITPEYLATITDSNLYEKLLDCLMASNQNAGSAILPFLNGDWFTSIASFFQGVESSQTNQDIEVKEAVTVIPVTIEINESRKSIDLSRDDIVDILENKASYYIQNDDELAEVVSILEETPIVFDRDGSIIFSNGLYSPAVINGVPIETTGEYEYIYLVRYVDESGNATEVNDNVSSLPENIFTNLIGRVFTNRSPFNLEQVQAITYRLVDPDQNIRSDEYYDYVITLVGGQQRAITVPEYSSVQLMRERFGSIGYQADVLALVSQATENTNPPKEGWVERLINAVKTTLGQFTNTPDEGDENNGYADLPVLGNNPTIDDINSVFIYPSATVYCPSGAAGYMYTAVIKDKTDSNFAYAVTDGRCGQGTPEELVAETARHLAERHMIEDVTAISIADKVSFRVDTVLFTPSITRVPVNTTPVITTPVTEPEETEPVLPTTPTTTPDQLPNLTNEVLFEVKAVGSDGRILSDWVDAEQLTISDGVELYFRWNGSSYQQCLAFLNDNGNYSLTRSNRAMITGNTEEEKYDITERSAVYRIECGGQRNNEFGVDAREIEVTIQ